MSFDILYHSLRQQTAETLMGVALEDDGLGEERFRESISEAKSNNFFFIVSSSKYITLELISKRYGNHLLVDFVALDQIGDTDIVAGIERYSHKLVN